MSSYLNHTAIPWYLDENGSNGYVTIRGQGGMVVHTDDLGSIPDEAANKETIAEEIVANAAFIVEACNNHEQMKRDLSSLREQNRKMGEVFKPKGEWYTDEACCVQCHASMRLNDGCEWMDDDRLNVCHGCALKMLQDIADLCSTEAAQPPPATGV